MRLTMEHFTSQHNGAEVSRVAQLERTVPRKPSKSRMTCSLYLHHQVGRAVDPSSRATLISSFLAVFSGGGGPAASHIALSGNANRPNGRTVEYTRSLSCLVCASCLVYQRRNGPFLDAGCWMLVHGGLPVSGFSRGRPRNRKIRDRSVFGLIGRFASKFTNLLTFS